MNKLQIQLQEIDNGILIQVPGVTQNDKIVEMPRALYCKDVDELCQRLQQLWPRQVKASEGKILSLK